MVIEWCAREKEISSLRLKMEDPALEVPLRRPLSKKCIYLLRMCGLRPNVEWQGCTFEDTPRKSASTSKLLPLHAAQIQRKRA